jgi:hypothetical protein
MLSSSRSGVDVPDAFTIIADGAVGRKILTRFAMAKEQNRFNRIAASYTALAILSEAAVSLLV